MGVDRDWCSLDEVERLTRGLPFPENFYRAERNRGIDNDGLFIIHQLGRLTLAQRSKAVYHYDLLYKNDESRRECNARLRRFADRCEAVNKGEVYKPRRIE